MPRPAPSFCNDDISAVRGAVIGALIGLGMWALIFGLCALVVIL